MNKQESELDRVFQLTRKTQQNIDMIGLSSTLSCMLDAIYIKSKNTVLETKEDKEYKLCSLLKTARVSKEELDKMSDVNIPEALFEGQRSKLNQILLSQHLLANGHKISQKALIALQMSNKVISKLRKEYSENNKLNGKYLLHKDLLHKIKTITENLKLLSQPSQAKPS